jgi:hypothetical protein
MIVSLLSISMIGVPVLVGCEKEVAHEKTVDQTPNGTTVKEKKVTENPDGSVTKTQTKDSSKNP